MISVRDVERARERIAPFVERTPVESSRTFSRAAGAEIVLKCENLQRTGSFKCRGALNRILALAPREKRRGVVAASAGNHAQGVAYAGAVAGVGVRIVMPEGAAIAKVEATRAYGAEVVLAGRDYAEAFERARELAASSGAVLVPAFDDEAVIAGQGTVGLEILEQVPDVERIVVPVGGGGLAAGVALAVEPRLGRGAVLGAEARATAALAASLRAGRRLVRPCGPTLADGLATSSVGRAPWAVLRGRVRRCGLVGEDEVASAILLLLERAKLVVEGAAAVALAACLGPLRREIAGRKVVVLLSGGNIDVNVLDRILNLGLAAQGRVFRFETVLPDRPGALSGLAEVIGAAGANIHQIRHERGRIGVGVLESAVTVDLETRGADHVPEIVERLEAAGYRVDPEIAEDGGRARSVFALRGAAKPRRRTPRGGRGRVGGERGRDRRD